MKQPVDHILRPALPWRDSPALTECGYDASKVEAIDRPSFFKREKDLGKQRAAMITCMTCAQTAQRWQTWEEDPRKALGREIEWESRFAYREDRGEQLKDELLAIATLVENNRDQFDSLVSEVKSRRDWVAKKDALARNK